METINHVYYNQLDDPLIYINHLFMQILCPMGLSDEK